jgi:short-subunit dehydrogenase
MNSERALITGASSGIGLHLAKEFAKHGHPLVITAPVEAELQQVAREIQDEYNVEVRVIAKDLEQENTAQELFDELRDTQVDILVNDAGHGQRGRFIDIPIERNLSIIRLNVEASVRLAKLFLAPMVQRGRGRLLNLASVAGFEPGPMLAIYHASKAFILSWTESIASELEDLNVTVTALCPGPTDTDFFPKADMLETRAFQQAMAPQDVAEAGYKGLMDGERVVVPGGMNKAMVFARRFLPESAQAKQNEALYRELPPEKEKQQRGDKEREAAEKD